jgi:predicted enzyme related to lactoylglutathione lyase
MVGPVDIPPGRFAVLADPSGAMFGVIALAAT